MNNEVMEAEFRDIEAEKYTDEYSEVGLWENIKDEAASIGLSLIY
ncbi:hypothetical protein [Schwartzia succinivorans]|jgi:hypothetical protein|uniref:Uncharacterized protein n=1 Tax=Schwartzia succinivorans DSM 10502 TaxID=1123243 RepID=A0A1M4XDR1_9FIRM|nr:hypothetical protein [Schwartzia succinivorans]SHE91749.1 hypothetical protein SAMN02745190_01452 [Schwartzia succinivorans DSM 10502]